MRNFHRIVLLFTFLLVAGTAQAKWEEVKYHGRPYVTVASLCEFYGFPVPTIPEKDFCEIEGKCGTFRFKMDSRDTYVNGRRCWLNFPVERDDKGRAIISKIDVVLTLDPLLRPDESVPKQQVKGVIIDPGHGGSDRGARSYSGYSEKNATLDTAQRLEKILKAKGVPVLMTRKDDVFISLEDRADFANDHPGWIFVSIHYNSGPRSVHGVETYAMTPQGAGSSDADGVVRTADFKEYEGNEHNPNNVILTGLIHNEMATMHSKEGDRGVKRARFVVLRLCKLPAVLVEGGFLTHKVDGDLIESSSYRQKVADAVSRGVLNYIALMDGKKPVPPAEKSKPTLSPAPTPTSAPTPAPVPTPAQTPTPAPTESQSTTPEKAPSKEQEVEEALKRALDKAKEEVAPVGTPDKPASGENESGKPFKEPESAGPRPTENGESAKPDSVKPTPTPEKAGKAPASNEEKKEPSPQASPSPSPAKQGESNG